MPWSLLQLCCGDMFLGPFRALLCIATLDGLLFMFLSLLLVGGGCLMRRHNRARVGGDVAVMVSGGERGRTTAGRALGGPPSCFVVAVCALPHQPPSDEHSITGRGCILAFERRGVGEGCRDPCCSFVAGPCAWVPDARCCAVPLLTVFFLCFSLFCLLVVVGVLCGGTSVRGLVGMWRSWCRAVKTVG